MSLDPCIDQLKQRLNSLNAQIKQNEEQLREIAAKVSVYSDTNLKLEAMKESTQEAIDALVSLQKSKKEVKNDTNQSKKTPRKSRTTDSGY